MRAEACISCGLCVPACPSGAVGGVDPSPALLVDVADAAGSRLEIRCTAAGPDDATPDGYAPWSRSVSCLAALDPEVLAAAAARLDQDGRLDLVRGTCEECPLGAGAATSVVVNAAAALGRHVAVGREIRAVERPTRPQGSEPAPAEGPPPPAPARRRNDRDPRTVSRRGFFQGRRYDRAGSHENQNRPDPDPAATAPQSGQPVLRSRTALKAASANAPTPRPFSQTGCTACGACVAVCPTQALEIGRTRTMATLGVEDRNCIACGECVRVCPEDALALGCSLPGTPRPSVGPLLVARVALASCARCGRTLSPGEEHVCAACATRRSILDDVWSRGA